MITKAESKIGGVSPLRYPGGKAKIASFVRLLIEDNSLTGGHYAEPYAGGAGIAFSLLATGHIDQVHLNNIDPAVYAFWRCVLDCPEDLCKLISDTRVTITEWKRQRKVQDDPTKHSRLQLGFSTFFLNRTNRSGIIKGAGAIGGMKQRGEWKLNARYYKKTLVARIKWIAKRSQRITLHSLDAETFMRDVVNAYSDKMLVYLDPPYYVKGHRLYEHHYRADDHGRVAALVQSELNRSWLVSYDDHPAITGLYKGRRSKRYGVPYSATKRTMGKEVMFFSDDLRLPSQDPC